MTFVLDLICLSILLRSHAIYVVNKITIVGGEMAQLLRTLPLQRTGVQFPAPICWLTMSCNSVSRSDFHEYVHIQTIHTCMQTEHLYMSNKKILKKNHAYIMFFLVWRFCYSTVFFFFYDKSFSCLHLGQWECSQVAKFFAQHSQSPGFKLQHWKELFYGQPIHVIQAILQLRLPQVTLGWVELTAEAN